MIYVNVQCKLWIPEWDVRYWGWGLGGCRKKMVPGLLARSKKIKRTSWRNGCGDGCSFCPGPLWGVEIRERLNTWDLNRKRSGSHACLTPPPPWLGPTLHFACFRFLLCILLENYDFFFVFVFKGVPYPGQPLHLFIAFKVITTFWEYSAALCSQSHKDRVNYSICILRR